MKVEKAGVGMGHVAYGGRCALALPLVLLLLSIPGILCPHSAVALTPAGDGTWFWQTPQPLGNVLRDVAFADAANVWAVGDAGTILRSSDGGITWLPQRSGTTAGIQAVTFVSSTEGWAVGNGILHTTDAGATWTHSAPAGSRELRDVCFVDREHGWAAGFHGILRTADGGATWTRRRVGPYSWAVACSFVSERLGWAGDGEGFVYRTRDGGITWKLLGDASGRNVKYGDDTFGLLSLSFSDARHGIATFLDARGEGRITRTSDGGRTWRTAVRLPGLFVTQGCFVGPREVWVAGSPEWRPVSVILHSTDGGATWTRRTVGRSAGVFSIAASGTSLCAVGSSILSSADGGMSWFKRTSGRSCRLASLAMSSGAHGWAVGAASDWAFTGVPPDLNPQGVSPGGMILHTDDGVSWLEQHVVPRAALTDVACVGEENAWAVGYKGLPLGTHTGLVLHTSDGGATWSSQSVPTDAPLTSVFFRDAYNGWATGGDYSEGTRGCLLRTADGGETWIVQPIPKRVILSSVVFSDSLHGWVAGRHTTRGADGCLLGTTDGGETWHEQTFALHLPAIERLLFTDVLHGWAVCGYPSDDDALTVLRTRDGGLTWSGVWGLRGKWIFGLDFGEADHGWAVGEGVYRTTDGGLTWVETRPRFAPQLWDVEAADATRIWTVGPGVVSTLDTAADTAAPATVDDADGRWHRSLTTITLSAADVGSAGLERTEYRLDGETDWRPVPAAGSIDFPAPHDHSGDGRHALAYRSLDSAGNVEATQTCFVKIDTQKPTPRVGGPVRVTRGSLARLRFFVHDPRPGSPRATVVLRIKALSGATVKTASVGQRAVNRWRAYSFRCWLAAGRYRYWVYARDLAGNYQTEPAAGRLKVL